MKGAEDGTAYTPYMAQLRALKDAFRIIDGRSFSWFGEIVRAPEPFGQGDSPLVPVLSRHLYENFYVAGYPVHVAQHGRGSAREIDLSWVESVAAEYPVAAHRHEAWTFIEPSGSDIIAETDGVRFSLPRGLIGGGNEALRHGSSVPVRRSAFLPTMMAGFSGFVGAYGHPKGNGAKTSRLYWNCHPDGVASLVAALARSLNGIGAPFTIKFVASPRGYERCDAVVLYVQSSQEDQILKLAASIHAEIVWALKDGVPAFTFRIARGLAFAEDPGTGESFGQHRCRLLSKVLCGHHSETGRRSLPLRGLIAALERTGISPLTPYRRHEGAGGTPVLSRFDATPRRITKPILPGPSVLVDHSVEAAIALGNVIVSKALWREGRCTWLGPLIPPVFPGSQGHGVPAWSPVGPDVYAGTAGIGVFLAQLAFVSGSGTFAEVSHAALLHAAEEAGRVVDPMQAGFFQGWSGIAFCLLHASRLLCRTDLAERADHLIRTRLGQPMVCNGNDWMSGLASHVTGLLLLSAAGLWPECLGLADDLGTALLARAYWSGDTATWANDHDPKGRPLTGLAHGAAGIGLSLAELAHATDSDKFRRAALAACAYERRWLRNAASNWVDLRPPVNIRGRIRKTGQFALAWCHGAPGIALSRIRMSSLLNEELLRDEAGIGLRAILCSLPGSLGSNVDNHVLCHGLGGNLMIANALARGGLEVPSRARMHLDRSVDHIRSTANLAARGGLISDWAASNPGLMTGAAGVGHALLCLTSKASCGDLASMILPGVGVADDFGALESSAKTSSSGRGDREE